MSVAKYAREVAREGRRIRWPKREQFMPTLVAVIIICVIGALFLSLEDWAAGTLINQLKDMFAGIGGGGAASSSAS